MLMYVYDIIYIYKAWAEAPAMEWKTIYNSAGLGLAEWWCVCALAYTHFVSKLTGIAVCRCERMETKTDTLTEAIEIGKRTSEGNGKITREKKNRKIICTKMKKVRKKSTTSYVTFSSRYVYLVQYTHTHTLHTLRKSYFKSNSFHAKAIKKK